jgi:hypothetical protein
MTMSHEPPLAFPVPDDNSFGDCQSPPVVRPPRAPRYDLEVLVTAVSERADLFVETMTSMLNCLEETTPRLIVHEDTRPHSRAGAIRAWLVDRGLPFEHRVSSPARGLGPAMRWCFQQARQPIVFYTQEDWHFVRPIPTQRCMHLMQLHNLNHVRFNKRKTMSAKHADTAHPWRKVEVAFADDDGVNQTMCISDHWYTQASLWRVAPALPGLAACADRAPQANAFVAAFNDWMNQSAIGATYRSSCMDQQTRHRKLKTYIWGPVGEPRFIEHLGTDRTTGTIVHRR